MRMNSLIWVLSIALICDKVEGLLEKMFGERRAQVASIASSSRSDSVVFGGVKFGHPLSTSLQRLGIRDPSPIQKASVAPLTSGLSCVLHAATGSGKTIAYLLPLLKRLTNSKESDNVETVQALILVPSKELAAQVAADINALVSVEESEKKNLVHLCLTTTRSGLSNISSPIVVGTPIKVLHAMRASPPAFLSGINYVVLDEVDRLLAVLGRYATAEKKQQAQLTQTPTEELLGCLLQGRGDAERAQLQVVAASATVGRPLRRTLCKILNGGTAFGDFPVIRGAEGAVDAEEAQPEGTSTSRDVTIPTTIRHVVVVVDSDLPISGKLAEIKRVWMSQSVSGIVRSKHSGGSGSGGVGAAEGIDRGLIFVPSADDVKQSVGMLRFWGLSEVKNLQEVMGLTSERPAAPMGKQRPGSSSGSPQSLTTEQLIDLATKGGMGCASSTSRQRPRASDDEVDDELQDAAPSIGGGGGPGPGGNDEGRPLEFRRGQSLLQRIRAPRKPTGNIDISGAGTGAGEGVVTVPRELFVTAVSGARGLHLADVRHVFVATAPRTMDEYLHLAGRTGRKGNREEGGTVVTYASLDEMKRLQSWQVPLGIRLEMKFPGQDF